MSSFEDMGFCKLDTDREQRTGFPEVVFGAGKTTEQIIEIVARLIERHGRAMVTRVTSEVGAELMSHFPDAIYRDISQIFTYGTAERVFPGKVTVLSGGTSDMRVAEEAAITAEWMGCEVERIYDVGVAGIDRLLAYRENIQAANVVIVVAGMEGALVSVVGGLVRRPVIAVPTSVGYGCHFQGLTPLLAMMTSCAAGISVVNIDNGFGAGYNAAIIQQLVAEAKDR
ncbi:NCAIR mutase (PurE)-related protein [Paenibacillus sp. DS2015]|uniref:nickel pincer cofactor biosynthesis protein LarB n=1 Tax=Paenibacillus sp. DS2015 TaxID=3373917 RepID=UPI003D25A582